MDLNKIGKFIALKRKELNLTQEELAKKVGVTNKTISRWENGNYMPDISLLIPLSEILNITLNELLTGEVIKNKKENLDNNIKSIVEISTKKQNKFKYVIYGLIIVIFLILIASFIVVDSISFKEEKWYEGDTSLWDVNYPDDKAYEMGLTSDGKPVFKDPSLALKQAKIDYAKGIDIIKVEFNLPTLSKYTYDEYKTYGWQVSIGSEEEKNEARKLSSFLDIYENSYR